MVELLIEIEYHEKVVIVKDKSPELREEYLNDFKGILALTNKIFEKMRKPLQTLETLDKHLIQMNSREDNM